MNGWHGLQDASRQFDVRARKPSSKAESRSCPSCPIHTYTLALQQGTGTFDADAPKFVDLELLETTAAESNPVW